jgi:hypothetical protein
MIMIADIINNGAFETLRNRFLEEGEGNGKGKWESGGREMTVCSIAVETVPNPNM